MTYENVDPLKEFMQDVDGEGTTWEQLMVDVVRRARACSAGAR